MYDYRRSVITNIEVDFSIFSMPFFDRHFIWPFYFKWIIIIKVIMGCSPTKSQQVMKRPTKPPTKTMSYDVGNK